VLARSQASLRLAVSQSFCILYDAIAPQQAVKITIGLMTFVT